jgi:histidinol phosphatase-like PHP family hydrolase/predicted nuclease with RNAse H fold/dephospho-CoA kinase
MFDFEIAFLLYKMSRILEIFENNKYKSRAFFIAGMAVDAYNVYFQKLYSEDKIKSIEGIGDSSSRIIKEIIETGKCKQLLELEKQYDIIDYSLILTHGIGSKTIRNLFSHGIKTIEQLKTAVNSDSISTLDLKKSESDVLFNFVRNYDKIAGRYLFSYIYCLRKELLDLLNENLDNLVATEIECAWEDKPRAIHITCKKGTQNTVSKLLSTSNRYSNVLQQSKNLLCCNTSFGIPVEITFSDVFAEKKPFPCILQGDLHMHTKWSDGKHSIADMADEAMNLGRKYIGITDHSYALKIARGMSEIDSLKQVEEIVTLRQKGIKVLSGIEVEILKDGSLDFSDAVLNKFDYVLAGIHTHLNQTAGELEARLEKALSNPYVNILAHPTGKLLGRPGVMFSSRAPLAIPFKNILEICEKNNVVVELNCFPERFDIGVEYFNDILESNVLVSVGTDAHSAAHLNCLNYAEEMLAKYPKLKKRIINTYSVNTLKEFFKNQRTIINKDDYSSASSRTLDFHYYFGNNPKIIAGKDVVIGIDLTGNEIKPSGWATLIGETTCTKPICSDDELIAESLKYNPKVISIDSPLSYPAGRCCTDPNCECKKHGITRYCERLLSSFGIGVYPCLIPSMENLTNRGISLAKKFRDLGMTVIESYPGVAQDILSIRRKQNGIEHLKNSYKNFGIRGDYLTLPKVSHDELDAIASALVGLFYINDQYIALGNEQENYLIVPSIAPKQDKTIVIGLTGEIGVGKTTLAEYLRFTHGFQSLRYSSIIQKLYACDNSRETLQKIGREISKDSVKQKQLSLEIIKRIEAQPNRNFVIDGLRHQEDFDMLNEHFGERFMLLYIQASFNNMLKRYGKCNHAEIGREAFQRIINDQSEKDIIKFMMHCYTQDNVINNNKTYKEYFESVELKLRGILCQ